MWPCQYDVLLEHRSWRAISLLFQLGHVHEIVEITKWHEIAVEEDNPTVLDTLKDTELLHDNGVEGSFCFAWSGYVFDVDAGQSLLLLFAQRFSLLLLLMLC